MWPCPRLWGVTVPSLLTQRVSWMKMIKLCARDSLIRDNAAARKGDSPKPVYAEGRGGDVWNSE